MFNDQKKENEMKEIGDPDKEAQTPRDNDVEEVHDFGNKPPADENEGKQEVGENIYGIGSGVDEEANRNILNN